MIKFKQLLEEIDRVKLERERAERVRRGIPDAGSKYLEFGHDDPDYRFGLTGKKLAELKKLKQEVWGVSDQERLPDLWASGPTIKLNTETNERSVAVRPLSDMSQTHADIFPDAYSKEGSLYKSHPHVYGRIDHQRRAITMNTNHRRFFSSSSLDRITRELKERFPGYAMVDLIRD